MGQKRKKIITLILMLNLSLSMIGINAGHHICNSCGTESFYLPWESGEEACISDGCYVQANEISCCSDPESSASEIPECCSFENEYKLDHHLLFESTDCCIDHIDSKILNANSIFASVKINVKYSGQLIYKSVGNDLSKFTDINDLTVISDRSPPVLPVIITYIYRTSLHSSSYDDDPYLIS